MSKELEALESIMKIYGNTNSLEGTYNYFLIIKKALKRLEAIDNANPSESLECLDSLALEVKIGCKEITTIKQALLKAQEPKQYLKWEDLEFKEERQTIKVRMGNTIYNLFFYKSNYSSYKRCHLWNEEETLIYDIQEQLFNDLHLERVEE